MMFRPKVILLGFLLLMLGLALVPGAANAGTVIGGDYVEVTVSFTPDQFRFFTAHFDAGEEVAYAVQGDTFDVFILNATQFEVYNTTGRLTAGWTGPSEQYQGSVQSGAWVFEAETAGDYYLVIDNTVAGANSGSVAKSTTAGVIFPYSTTETSDLPGLSFIILAGIFVVAAVVFGYFIGGRKRD